jgi:virginiamycin B lyase
MALLAAVAGVSAGAYQAAAAPTTAPATGAGTITIYSSPGIHFSTASYTYAGITAGPDGALWFTNAGNNTIGRITTTGSVKDYKSAGIANPWIITPGPDGALWFINWDTPSIGRITIAGAVKTFTGAMYGPASLAASSSGALWYTNWAEGTRYGWSIGRMTTKGASVVYKAKGIAYPQNITAGPDGALWFTNGGVNGGGYAIGRITTSGSITMYPLTRWPAYIAAGPDGAVWFTYTHENAIGRITTKGVLTSYTGAGIAGPMAIAAGPDGALWFTENGAIGRITTKGKVSRYAVPGGLKTIGANIAAGPDGAMWFTNPARNTIGRITTSVTPAIYGKTPASGARGTLVTITGRNLAHATQVAFNGAPAVIVADTATYVVAIVPPAATTGRITVTTSAGTAARNGWFVVTRTR